MPSKTQIIIWAISLVTFFTTPSFCQWQHFDSDGILLISSNDEFKKAIVTYDYLLVHFSQKKCMPCMKVNFMMRKYQPTQDSKMNAVFAQIDVEKYPEFVEIYEIFYVPTVLMVAKGLVIEHIVDSDKDFQIFVKGIQMKPQIQHLESKEDYEFIKYKYRGDGQRRVGKSMVILHGGSEEVRKMFGEVSMLMGNIKFFTTDSNIDLAKIEDLPEPIDSNGSYLLLITNGKSARLIPLFAYQNKMLNIQDYPKSLIKQFWVDQIHFHTAHMLRRMTEEVFRKIFQTYQPALILFFERESVGLRKKNIFAKIDMERVGKRKSGEMLFVGCDKAMWGRFCECVFQVILGESLNETDQMPMFVIVDPYQHPETQNSYAEIFKLDQTSTKISERKIQQFLDQYNEFSLDFYNERLMRLHYNPDLSNDLLIKCEIFGQLLDPKKHDETILDQYAQKRQEKIQNRPKYIVKEPKPEGQEFGFRAQRGFKSGDLKKQLEEEYERKQKQKQMEELKKQMLEMAEDSGQKMDL